MKIYGGWRKTRVAVGYELIRSLLPLQKHVFSDSLLSQSKGSEYSVVARHMTSMLDSRLADQSSKCFMQVRRSSKRMLSTLGCPVCYNPKSAMKFSSHGEGRLLTQECEWLTFTEVGEKHEESMQTTWEKFSPKCGIQWQQTTVPHSPGWNV